MKSEEGSGVVGAAGASLAPSRFAPTYIARAEDALVRAGEDGYSLRIEARRVWTRDGVSGGTALVGRAQGELADVKMDGEAVMEVTPRPQIPYGVAKILIAMVDNPYTISHEDVE